MAQLISPPSGQLLERYLSTAEATRHKIQAQNYPSWDLDPRQLCDLALLLNGGFWPLDGFLKRADYERVITDMRLSNGALWPMPITLDVSEEFASRIAIGKPIALRDSEGVLIAVMDICDLWQPDLHQEAAAVFGTVDADQPGVFALLHQTRPVYIGGPVYGIEAPTHYDFPQLRHSPQVLRNLFVQRGWQKIIAFQPTTPMHRAEQQLTLRALQQLDAQLLLHPSMEPTPPGDRGHYTQVRCYQHILQTYPADTAVLSLLDLTPRLAGPRAALWHALIHQNYGCSHFLIPAHHPAPRSEPESTNPPLDAAYALARRYQDELSIQILTRPDMVYVPERGHYLPSNEVQSGETTLHLSASEVQRRLREGSVIPEWFSYPQVLKELRRRYPPRYQQGFTVFFTGLSGSGKSTIANALMVKLLELGGRHVTLLDGDLIRKHLSSELGFSREHRNINILRIGFVASEITKHGGIAICAPIAPYAAIRRQVRELIEPLGGFIEVHVATPLELCESRDRKGLYAKARAGILKEFTGVSDPYEMPVNPELVIETHNCTPSDAVQRVVSKLERLGYIRLG
jgi:sulfate adenylyltransferase